MSAQLKWSMIETFDFTNADCLELTRVRDDGVHVEPVDDDSEPFTHYALYAHGDANKGAFLGVDCIADFTPETTEEQAAQFCRELAIKHNLQFGVQP